MLFFTLYISIYFVLVILARIKRSKIINQNRIYKVRVRKEYKLSEKASAALKSGRLITPASESMCGQTLEPGKLYAISEESGTLKPTSTFAEWQYYGRILPDGNVKVLKLCINTDVHVR